uniref:Uncharacterized protein n=1 Tax=Leptospira santarosai serovar Arenal str. MAVJ 401 TaxID=1049976 RepID=M6JTH1_9LEPT|nr:hypothetical protein LEP1GSC063_1819 [Leptospira santarosai serovar Arenal str. MAVJ 401]
MFASFDLIRYVLEKSNFCIRKSELSRMWELPRNQKSSHYLDYRPANYSAEAGYKSRFKPQKNIRRRNL